jgi:predicted ArsR family transcriptional regulator
LNRASRGRPANAFDAIAAVREPVRQRLYEYVRHAPAAVSRDEAARATGLARHVVAFHLDKLAEAGVLTVEFRRLTGRSGPGAGRPSKLYRPASRRIELSLPQRQHRLLARFLAGGVTRGIEGGAVARRYGWALGRRARRRQPLPPTATPEGCTEAILDRLGFAPRPDGDAGIAIRSCPFDPLSRRYDKVVCAIGRALVEGVVDGSGANLWVDRASNPGPCCLTLRPGNPAA